MTNTFGDDDYDPLVDYDYEPSEPDYYVDHLPCGCCWCCGCDCRCLECDEKMYLCECEDED